MFARAVLFFTGALFALGAHPASAQPAENLIVPSAEFATIQSAVDAAVSGQTIVVNGGTYSEDITIDGVNGITIEGQKGATIEGAGGVSVVTIINADDVTLRGLGLSGGGPFLLLIGSDCDRCVIEKVAFSSASNGLLIASGVGHQVLMCTFTDIFGGNAVTTTSPTSSAVFVGNRVFDASGDGFSLRGAGHVLIRNRVDQAGSTAIQIYGRDMFIENNRLTADGPVVRFEGEARTCVLERNRIVGGALSVIMDAGVTGVVIRDNRIVGAKGPAIRLGGLTTTTSGLTISRNRISKPAGGGISIGENAGRSVVSDNRIVGSTGSGITLEEGAQESRFVRNFVRSSGMNGIDVGGEGSAFVLNNVRGSGELDLAISGDAILVDNSFKTTNN